MSPGPTHGPRFRMLAGVTAEAAMTHLATGASGLSEAVAARRLEADGPNEIGKEKPPHPFVLFLRQLYDPLVGILLFAATVSMVAREWTDAGVVLGIVLLSAVLSFLQEWRASAAVAKLTARIAPRTTVVRHGEARSVPSRELVAGDVVELSAGSLVPADALVIEAKDFLVNEAVLTGETFPVEKRPGTFAAHDPLSRCRSVVFAGTSVQSGRARVLVVATAHETEFGQVASRLRLRPVETDFERGVRHFGRLVSQVMFVLVGVVFVLNVVTEKPPIEALLFAIAIAVGMAPELLPAVLTITLSRGARDMAERGVIVRRLAAIENLGSMDVLCTDKTGTLTEGVVALEGAEDAEGHPRPRRSRSPSSTPRSRPASRIRSTGRSSPRRRAPGSRCQPSRRSTRSPTTSCASAWASSSRTPDDAVWCSKEPWDTSTRAARTFGRRAGSSSSTTKKGPRCCRAARPTPRGASA